MLGPPTVTLGDSLPDPESPGFPGGRIGATVALGAAGLLLFVHAANALFAGSSLLATALWWLLGIGVVTVAAARAALTEAERHVWVPAAIAFTAWFIGSAYYGAS